MTMTLCLDCGAVLSDGTRHCPACRENLLVEVRNARAVLGDLEITLSRRDAVVPPSAGGRSATTPLPFHVGASVALVELRAAIRALARGPVDADAVRRFRAARGRALTAVDTPDPRVFLGRCPCGAALYARTGDVEVECRSCGETWSATPPEAWDELRRLAGPVPRLREWLLALGVKRSRATLYRDVAKLEPVGGDGAASEYLLADLFDLVAREKARRVTSS